MISVVNCNKNNFIEKIEGKRVFCFGSGSCFRKFVLKYPQIPIRGVIDNYRKEQIVMVENRTYKVCSVTDFCNIYDEDCVLVITVRLFEDVVDQLDMLEELNGISCFFPFVFEDCFDVNDEQRYIMENQVRALAERANVTEKKPHERKVKGKRCQIWEYYERTNTGGSKARTDISDMLAEQGYEMKKVHCAGVAELGLSDRQAQKEWKELFESIEENTILFMQHPAPMETKLPEQLLQRLKKEKHIRFIVMVHEVESLRKTYHSQHRQKEFETICSVGDIFIVHNDVMQRFFVNQGIDQNRIVSLGIFDYLNRYSNTRKKFEKSITIAANLNVVKSPYLLRLKELEALKVHLYGPEYSKNISEGSGNICYHGSLPTEVIPQKLNRGFGLIWDGDSIETCSGGTGEYLKYNNPHKLSLYLSAGLPVIIWSKAAQAQFVLKSKVGFCVDSLSDICGRLDKMTEEQYKDYVQNAEMLSSKLKCGAYFKAALKKAEGMLLQESI